MKRFLAATIVLVGCTRALFGFAGTRIITENAYAGCVELSNATTRVVLEPNLGGRVLKYELNGKNVIYVDPKFDGRVYEPGVSLNPTAGRFDIGPEKTVPKHPALFQGKWTASVTGVRQAEMVSVVDAITGVQLVRSFKLAEVGSHLECTQTIRNRSNEVKRYCFWGRTLAKPNGIAILPLNDRSRYPARFITFGPADTINFKPAPEENARVREDLLEILGPVRNPKFMTDAYEGWVAYITPDNLLFLKFYAADPSQHYGEIAAGTAAVHYTRGRCELEPIGPMQTIDPRGEASFTEHWLLLDYPYPADKTADLPRLKEIVQQYRPRVAP